MRVYIFPAKYDCSTKTSTYLHQPQYFHPAYRNIYQNTWLSLFILHYLKDGVRRCINNNNNTLILGQHCCCWKRSLRLPIGKRDTVASLPALIHVEDVQKDAISRADTTSQWVALSCRLPVSRVRNGVDGAE